MSIWVDETSATLDISDSINKYGRSQNHLNLNKFRRDEDFRTLAAVFKEIVQEGPEIIARRSEC
jgi:hypothetical protein